MKRFIALLLTMCMLLCLVACGDKYTNSIETGNDTYQNETTNIPINETDTSETTGKEETTTIPVETTITTETTSPPVETTNNINNKNTINLNKYISVRFEGYNLAGSASVNFDEEKFLLDNINNISFNEKNLQAYRELYGNSGKSAAYYISNYFGVSLNKSYNLKNGDMIETVWTFNTEKLESYFIWDYICPPQSFTVTGLKEAETFDPFEDFNITFSSIAPYGEASISSHYRYGGSYTLSKEVGLSNDDIITVTYSCNSVPDTIRKYGAYPSCYEKTYTVSGLNTYVQSVNELSNEQINQLVSEARDKVYVQYKKYEDAKYCGNYFYTAKGDTPPGSPYKAFNFLSLTHYDPIGNTICFVFEHPEKLDVDNSPNAYTVIFIENLLINEKGELLYNKNSMSETPNKYESKDALKKAFIGVYDDNMYCVDNVNFD